MKQTLAVQIAEVKREIALRQSVYPGLVGRGKMRQSEADLHTDRIKAVLGTLEWLQANETTIRSYVDAMNAAPELKGKIPLVMFFDDDVGRQDLIDAFKAEKPNVRTIKF